MKKKIIAIGLITTMVICNSMTVWAADTWDNGGYNLGYDETDDTKLEPDSADRTQDGGGQKDVKANINLGDPTESFSVTIEWGALTFSKDINGITSSWNDTDATYTIEDSNDKWNSTDASNQIKVTNKSNVKIKASFTGEFNTTMANDYGITATGGAIKIKDASNAEDQTAQTNGDLKLAASTSAEGVIGSKFVGVVGTITKAKDLTKDDVKLGTVTVTIEKDTTT